MTEATIIYYLYYSFFFLPIFCALWNVLPRRRRRRELSPSIWVIRYWFWRLHNALDPVLCVCELISDTLPINNNTYVTRSTYIGRRRCDICLVLNASIDFDLNRLKLSACERWKRLYRLISLREATAHQKRSWSETGVLHWRFSNCCSIFSYCLEGSS